ncbi:MAG: hypothetical protein JO305_02950 [Alphaproteobacteria bacterium]|nr:hypothetical protein [Alphaproteobacteria bacterium]
MNFVKRAEPGAAADLSSLGDDGAAPRRIDGPRSWLAEFVCAPFRDVDDRVRIKRR